MAAAEFWVKIFLPLDYYNACKNDGRLSVEEKANAFLAQNFKGATFKTQVTYSECSKSVGVYFQQGVEFEKLGASVLKTQVALWIESVLRMKRSLLNTITADDVSLSTASA